MHPLPPLGGSHERFPLSTPLSYPPLMYCHGRGTNAFHIHTHTCIPTHPSGGSHECLFHILTPTSPCDTDTRGNVCGHAYAHPPLSPPSPPRTAPVHSKIGEVHHTRLSHWLHLTGRDLACPRLHRHPLPSPTVLLFFLTHSPPLASPRAPSSLLRIAQVGNFRATRAPFHRHPHTHTHTVSNINGVTTVLKAPPEQPSALFEGFGSGLRNIFNIISYILASLTTRPFR